MSRGAARALAVATMSFGGPVFFRSRRRAIYQYRPVSSWPAPPLRVRSEPAAAPEDLVSMPLGAAVPCQALRLVETLARDDDQKNTTVLCSHGDVISEMLYNLMLTGVRTHGDRGCAKGSVWELSCRRGVVVEGRYHPPPTV